MDPNILYLLRGYGLTDEELNASTTQQQRHQQCINRKREIKRMKGEIRDEMTNTTSQLKRSSLNYKLRLLMNEEKDLYKNNSSQSRK
ncbi:hypothetical protein FACS189472_14550 [Alphaproteobacteria bacterium]|nr:hypothetical protein FACS189472_14550 [Alphaproteobacteria bacterium]